MNWLNKIQTPAPHLRVANALRKLLFAYVIFSFIQLVPNIGTLYGSEGIILSQDLHGYTLTTLVNLLSVKEIQNLYPFFFAIQILFAFTGLLGVFPRFSTLIVFFTTINLQNRIYSTVSGGDILLQLLLFYLIFISGGKKLRNENLEQLKNSSDRVFISLCKVQVVIIYFTSSVYKLLSPEWMNGSAIQKVVLLNAYSLPGLQNLACSAGPLFQLITWVALLYQILFPVFVFVKPMKRYVIWCGIILHLFIAFTMGLFNFSLVMIISYVIFLDVHFPEKNKLRALHSR